VGGGPRAGLSSGQTDRASATLLTVVLLPVAARRLVPLRTLLVLGLAGGLCVGCDGAAWCERFKIDCDTQGGVLVPTVVDLDSDGFSAPEDCDDGNGSVHPLANEICDGRDNDCNGQTDEGTPGIRTWYRDLDRDGFGTEDEVVIACDGPQGFVLQGEDCDDFDNRIFPEADEICDGKDNDCDLSVDEDLGKRELRYRDVDEDGYGVEASVALVCGDEAGWSSSYGDCNDSIAEVNPGVEEICNNSRDDDCDGFADPCTVRGERSLEPSDGLLLVGSAKAAVGSVMMEQWDRASNGAIAVGAPDHGVGGEVLVVPLARIDVSSGLEPARGVMGIEAEGARLGASLAPMGQLIGDYGLLAVGAPGYDGAGADAGLVLLATFEAGYEQLADYPGSVEGLGAGMELGASVVTVGDPSIGLSRLAAGAPGADDGDGAVFLFADLVSLGAFTTDDATTVLREGGGRPGFGAELLAGDVDGDGDADLLVSSAAELDGETPLWLFFSPDLDGEVLATDVAMPIAPLGSADRLGARRSLVMDVNADGTADLVLGGPGAGEGRGATWVVLGGVELEDQLAADGLSGAAARIEGISDGQALGSSLASARLEAPTDLTPWLLIGAPGPDSSASEGSAALFLTPLEGVISVASAEGTLRMEAGLGFGGEGTLLPVGDLTRDGRPDLVFGLPGLGAGDLMLWVTPNF